MNKQNKPGRRGHHEGSVYFVAERNRWVAEISTAPGQRKKYYCQTKQEAIRKKNEALRELEQGTLAQGPQRRLGAYLNEWLENMHKDTVRLSTYVKYKKLIKYITVDLGGVCLQKLTPEQVQRFYRKKLQDGLSSKTVHDIHGVLHLALKQAVRWNYVSRNVCELLSAPRVVSREGTALTLIQARQLVERMQGHELETLVLMAVVTGMRRGELLALRWSAVDLEHRMVHVLRTVDYLAGYGYVENEPKTQAGKRTIELPAFLIDLLLQYREEQERWLLAAGSAWEPRDLIFSNPRGGYLNPGYVLRRFKRLLKEAGLPPMRFHDLRHSAATLLISMGLHARMVQGLLGHSDIAITLGIYGHLFPSMQQEIVQKWQEVFGQDQQDDSGEEPGGVVAV